jgi:hypothetical protein
MIRRESVEDTFTELVDHSVEEIELDISPTAKSYVVGVLCSFVRRPEVSGQSVQLVDLLRDGLSATGNIRTEYLRITGDLAMVVSGVFPDSIERKHRRSTHDLGYVMDIGQKAYISIYKEPFEELADNFAEIVDVLNNVSGKLYLISKDLEKYVSRRRFIDARITRR